MAPKRKSDAGGSDTSLEDKIAMVVRALKSRDNNLEGKLKTLLAKLAPIALKEDILARHTYHDEVVSEIEDAFMLMERKMKADLKEAVVEAEKVAATRKLAEDTLDQAQAKLNEADAELSASKTAVQNAEQDVNTALEACNVAKKEHKSADKDVAKAKKEAEGVKALNDSFKCAVAGGVTAPGLSGSLKTLGQELEQMKEIPESLAKAAPTVLRKAPDTREAFDRTVVQSLSEALSRALTRAEEDKATAEAAASSGDSRIAEMESVFDGACRSLAAANTKRNECDDSQKEAETERDAAEEHVDSFCGEANRVRKDFEDMEAKVANFYTELCAFRYLQVRNESFEPPRSWSPCRASRRPALLDESRP